MSSSRSTLERTRQSLKSSLTPTKRRSRRDISGIRMRALGAITSTKYLSTIMITRTTTVINTGIKTGITEVEDGKVNKKEDKGIKG